MNDRATSKSWNSKPLRGDPRPVPFFRNLTSAEAQRVLDGLIPEVMEDKWFIFEQDDIVRFCRSWTGYTLYQVALSQAPDGTATLHGAVMNVDPEQNPTPGSEDYNARMLAYLVNRLLLGQDNISFSVPSNVSPEKSAFFMHHVVGHARRFGGQQ
jgi:hypothetical protein